MCPLEFKQNRRQPPEIVEKRCDLVQIHYECNYFPARACFSIHSLSLFQKDETFFYIIVSHCSWETATSDIAKELVQLWMLVDVKIPFNQISNIKTCSRNDIVWGLRGTNQGKKGDEYHSGGDRDKHAF